MHMATIFLDSDLNIDSINCIGYKGEPKSMPVGPQYTLGRSSIYHARYGHKDNK
jgi:hypothetical protein